jgi:hypothetical protein
MAVVGTSMAASISVPTSPEVFASAAGEEGTRGGLRRAYLLLARRLQCERPADILRFYLLCGLRRGGIGLPSESRRSGPV